MGNADISEGTFAAPLYYIPEGNPAYEPAKTLFDRIKWPKPLTRDDAKKNRFNAFCSLLWTVTEDDNWILYTSLNKSDYSIRKWPIGYRSMSETVKALEAIGWLKVLGKRQQNRSVRYIAPPKSPMRTMEKFKVQKFEWNSPVVEIRRGNTDLPTAPLDVELMANPVWKSWIAKTPIPVMEALNNKLSQHEFTLFPNGKSNEYDWLEPQYQRIYTNTANFKSEPNLLHGRIYPLNFKFPEKSKGFRQMTLIDGQPTVEVDVHASSLTILSNDYYNRFDLPETDDLYRYGALSDLNRDLTKIVIQAVINGVPLSRTSWPKSFKDDTKTSKLIIGKEWVVYAKAVENTYPALKNLDNEKGMWLMLEESDIILKAMNDLLDKGIGCLSIHDCLIVPEANTEDAKQAFYSAYESKGYHRPKLSVQ